MYLSIVMKYTIYYYYYYKSRPPTQRDEVKHSVQDASKVLGHQRNETTFTPGSRFKPNSQHYQNIFLFSTIYNQFFKSKLITEITDSSSFTILRANILSGDIVLSELILLIIKSLFLDHVLPASYKCIPYHIDTLHCKKPTSVMLGSMQSKNFFYSQIFDQQSLQTYAE